VIPTQRIPALLLTLATGLMLVACSSTVDAPSEPPHNAPVITASPVPTTPMQTISYGAGYQGYFVKTTVSFAQPVFSSSIVNAPPGSSDVEATVEAQGTITNDTPGRATYSLTGEGLLALYNLSSPVCKKGLPTSKSACFLILGSILSPQGAQAGQAPIPPDGDEPIVWKPSELTFSVPEGEAETWVKAFNAPIGYAVRQGSNWLLSGSCTVFVTGEGLGDGADFSLASYPPGFKCT